MVASQHMLTFGTLLLACSLVVALPQEKTLRNEKPNRYKEVLRQESDKPGKSSENVQVKHGRTIHQSAWSTDDFESNEENLMNNKSVQKEESSKRHWPLSYILRLALNYVNKLRREAANNKTENKFDKNVSKSQKTVNEDTYLQLFKKWLRKNKILKDDDSLSSDVFEGNSYKNIYNRKRNQMKSKEKPKNVLNSSKDNKKNYNRKRNNIKNSNSDAKYEYQQKTLKRNYSGTSDTKAADNGSKCVKSRKTNDNDSLNDENCGSIESFGENEVKDSEELINSNRSNEKVEEKEADLTILEDGDICRDTSAETQEGSSLESNGKVENNHEVLRKSHDNKYEEEIYPDTQALTSLNSDSFTSNSKQHSINTPNSESENFSATQSPNSNTSSEKLSKTPKSGGEINIPLDTASAQSQSKTTQNGNPNNLQDIESSYDLTTIPESATSSENQSETPLKSNSENLQKSESVRPEETIFPQTTSESIRETTNSIPESHNSIAPETATFQESPNKPQEKVILKEYSNSSETMQNLPLETISRSNTSHKTSGKNTPKENQNRQQVQENAPLVTVPNKSTASKSQNIRIQKEKDKHKVEALNLSENENTYGSTDLGSENFSKKHKQNLSYTSSTSEDFSGNEMKKQARKNYEQQGKYDTYLQYIYGHSNSSYFQSL